MRLLNLYSLPVTLATCALLAFSGPAGRADEPNAEEQVAQNQTGQNATQSVVPPAPLLVTGTADKLSVVADRADVLSVLSLVFSQAERDFKTDNSVSGQVTIRLSGKPLHTVLEALCENALLRYRVDPATGIYSFSRDDEALRKSITKVDAFNLLLLEQLRAKGLTVPFVTLNRGQALGNQSYFGTPYGGQQRAFAPNNAYGGLGTNGSGLNGGGGFRGGGGGSGGQDTARGRAGQPNRAPRMPTPQNSVQSQQPSGRATLKSGKTEPMAKALRRANEGGGRAADSVDKTADSALSLNGALADNSVLYFPADNLGRTVSLYVPAGKPIPVTTALEQLAAQAEVPIQIDPQVPQGAKFRFEGNIPSRPLAEALNLLAPTARLEWRVTPIGIIITASPEFQIFFGDSDTARVAYPALYSNVQRNVQDSKSGASGPPITHSEAEKREQKQKPKDKGKKDPKP